MYKHSIQVAIAALFIVALPAAANDVQFQVIVHPSTAVNDMKSADVTKLFLGQVSRWPDGARVHAVDLDGSDPVRGAFSEKVLKARVTSVKRFWYQRVFAGQGVPPPIKSSAADVVAFVASTPGAIGYVSLETDIKGCKVLGVAFD